MAKRDQSLVFLSQDHHHGLALALRLRQGTNALVNDGWTHDRNVQAGIVRKFYHEELSVHFALEEEILFPAMRKHVPESSFLIDALVHQHRQMEGLVRQLESGDVLLERVLIDLGVVLEQHIRSEERELFAQYELLIPSDLKQRLGEELQKRLTLLKADHS